MLVFSMVFAISLVRAESNWSALIRAKDPAKLQYIVGDSNQLQSVELNCRNQLANETWPTSCFQVLIMEESITRKSASRTQSARAALTNICRRVAGAF